jgi:beta-glucosidase
MTTSDVEQDALSPERQVALLSGDGFWHTEAVPEHGLPAAMLSDGPHGLRRQPDGAADQLGLTTSVPATCFPTAAALASSWDEGLVADIGTAIGREAAALGVGVVLGPGLNLKRHPLCGRSFEYFSEDPLLSGRFAAAMVTGIQATGVGACVKHFAVNNQESHRFVVDAVVDERTLRELYLAGFEHVVRSARPWAVMAAYNSVNGTSCTEHRRLLTEILRDEWGFEGLVMSDWGATGDRVAAVRAGMDLEMPGSGGVNDGVVTAAVRDGRLPADDVARSADRVVELARRCADAPGGGEAGDPQRWHSAHHALARRAAAAGTVLLTNDGLLPLRPDTRIALIGAFAEQPRFQGTGSSRVMPTRVDSLRDELERRATSYSFEAGYDAATAAPDPAAITAAADAARAADVAVVVVGLPDSWESEGFDREDLALPPQHDDLVRAVATANPRTVVAVCGGGVVAVPWADDVAAVLACHLGGQAGGAALADVLLGDAEPSGRLAESWPVRLDDLAATAYFPGDAHQVEHREGLFVGYRHLVSAGVPARFAFGHGLGYATFEWDEIALDRDEIDAGEVPTVTVRVRNTGPRRGSDVVQVYVRDRTGLVLRPAIELAGFARVELAAGEVRTVTIPLRERAFACYDTGRAGWCVPDGAYDVVVARSSVDAVASLPVRVRGGVTEVAEPADTPPVSIRDEDWERRLGRPIPSPRPVRPYTRDSTMGEIARHPAGRLLRAAMLRASPIDPDSADDPATRRMMERSIDELPLRAAVLFSGGRLSWPVVDGLLDVLNNRPVAVGRRVAGGVVRVTRGAAGLVVGRMRRG